MQSELWMRFLQLKAQTEALERAFTVLSTQISQTQDDTAQLKQQHIADKQVWSFFLLIFFVFAYLDV